MSRFVDLWDAQSINDFNAGELQLFNAVEKLEREWTSIDQMSPQDAIAQLERIKSTVNFMLQAAKWAR